MLAFDLRRGGLEQHLLLAHDEVAAADRRDLDHASQTYGEDVTIELDVRLQQHARVWLDTRMDTWRLDLNRVESDVHRFRRLYRAASLMPVARALETWTRARKLYRGDPLDGPGARS